MKERPIIFSKEMVKAILEGRKTQTRRVVKLKPHPTGHSWGAPYYSRTWWKWLFIGGWGLAAKQQGIKCPYGQVGDRLWVRETWATEKRLDWTLPNYLGNAGDVALWYKSEWWAQTSPLLLERGKWRPSIHMPRWASRILLEITEVRVERVQDIAWFDIPKEGIQDDTWSIGQGRFVKKTPERLLSDFKHLWDSINARRGYSWDTNPWVWVISFKP
jgi:hypothetical protein